jgi:hypothetical protein
MSKQSTTSRDAKQEVGVLEAVFISAAIRVREFRICA